MRWKLGVDGLASFERVRRASTIIEAYRAGGVSLLFYKTASQAAPASIESLIPNLSLEMEWGDDASAGTSLPLLPEAPNCCSAYEVNLFPR